MAACPSGGCKESRLAGSVPDPDVASRAYWEPVEEAEEEEEAVPAAAVAA